METTKLPKCRIREVKRKENSKKEKTTFRVKIL